MTHRGSLTRGGGANSAPRAQTGRVGGENIAVVCGGGSQITDDCAGICEREIVAFVGY